MKINLRRSFYLMAAVAMFFTSCSKQGPAGPTGPAGANGAAGTAGATGATGATGAQGVPGSANVIYSAWLDITFQPDTATSTTTGNLDTLAWEATIPAAQLVDSILNKGTIKVYLNLGGDSSGKQVIVTLPLSDPFLTGYTINPYFTNKTISLISNGDAGSFTDNSGNKRWQYRYVLIPGGTAAGRNPKGAINWNNYAEVKTYLGLKD